MAKLTEITDAIRTQLDRIDGLRVFSEPPQGATPPMAFPMVLGWETSTMGRAGVIEVELEVVILTAETVRPQDGYRTLLRYADHTGSDSVFLALWDGNDHGAGTFVGLSDTHLDTGRPGAFRILGIDEIDAYQMYGGAVSVRVFTKG